MNIKEISKTRNDWDAYTEKYSPKIIMDQFYNVFLKDLDFKPYQERNILNGKYFEAKYMKVNYDKNKTLDGLSVEILVKKHLIDDNKIIINKLLSFNDIFGDPYPGIVKVLIIIIDNLVYEIPENRDGDKIIKI